MTLRDPRGTAYEAAGPIDAPVVALVHGPGLNRVVWQWMIPVLTRRFGVLSCDFLGHGESPPLVVESRLRDLSDQLAALLDHLNMAGAALVGFSLGGMVARRFAQDHPGRVLALVLLHTAHRRSTKAQSAIQFCVAQAEAHGPGATVELAQERWYSWACRTARPGLMDVTRAWALANEPKVYPLLYRILADGVEEIVAPDPPISCPAPVLTGDEDFGNGPKMSAAVAAEIAGARPVVLKGLRHMALAEAPEAVNRPVMEFLTEVLG